MATFTQMVDDMKTCPYNPLHKVSARRLQQHIVKCSKNSANPVLQDCPFNALHKIPPEEYKQHILTCKDSRQVIREIEDSRNRIPVRNNVVEQERIEHNFHSEDWDEDSDDGRGEGYVIKGLIEENENDSSDDNSKKYRFKSNIEIQCMQPKERKAYYKLMVEKTKEAKEIQLKNETEKSSRPLSPTNTPLKNEPLVQTSGSDTTVKSEASVANELRKPNTKPFSRIGGIGRGNTPPVSSRSGAFRGVGRGVNAIIGNNNSIGIQPKREREDDSTDKPLKRFSPDLY